MRVLASSVGVTRVQRPRHRDALERSRGCFSPGRSTSELTVGEQDGQDAGRAATNPISRSVTNNGSPDGTHVLASVTKHRPEPWRHRTCGFVKSGRSRPTRNAASWRKTSVCQRGESQAVGAASTGQRARPVPQDLLCSRSATSRRSARSPQLRGTRKLLDRRRCPARTCRRQRAPTRRTLAQGLASVFTSVSISGP